MCTLSDYLVHLGTVHFRPDENEVQEWVERFKEEPRRRAKTAYRLRQFYLDPAILHVQSASRGPTTDSDVLAALWERFDPTGVKREAWRRVHGSEMSSPFGMYGLELSDVARSRRFIRVFRKGEDGLLHPWNALTDSAPSQEQPAAPTTNAKSETPAPLSDHGRRVAKVERDFSPRGRDGKPAYVEFYDGKATPQQFSDWKRGDQRRTGKAWPLLEAAADDLPN
jgi:hypothetical protein